MAVDVSGQAPGGQRTYLAQQLPLDTPYLIEFFVEYACNFRCKYCIHSVPVKDRGYISSKREMDLQSYKKCIDDIASFPKKLKVLRFAGMGEPLLHNDIVDMVKYASDKEVADKIEILTNGSLLTHDLSDRLIDAGLTRLYVSLQGLTGKRYEEVCGHKINFSKFVENIEYYFIGVHNNHSRQQLHIKIMDYALKDAKDKQKFYDTFNSICDTIGIEYASPIYPYVDYDQVLGDKKNTVTQFGLDVNDIQVCPQPFFRLHVIPNLKVVGCYSMLYPTFVGDCNKESLFDIWNGELLKKFRLSMLEHGLKCNNVCSQCEIIKLRLFKEDVLDYDIEKLKKVYK